MTRTKTKREPYAVRMAREVREHCDTWSACADCELGETATNHVFFRGVVPCEVLFIGEAPGESEDITGQPFTGRSGKLLNEIVADAVTLLLQRNWELPSAQRQWREHPSICFANILCCRPSNNADPTPAQAEACRPRLLEFIEDFAQPKHVVLLGKVTGRLYPADDLEHLNLNVVSLHHPAYVLRRGGKSSHEYDRMVLELTEGLMQ